MRNVIIVSLCKRTRFDENSYEFDQVVLKQLLDQWFSNFLQPETHLTVQ